MRGYNISFHLENCALSGALISRQNFRNKRMKERDEDDQKIQSIHMPTHSVQLPILVPFPSIADKVNRVV